jgi:cytochrome c oxidase subunit II
VSGDSWIQGGLVKVTFRLGFTFAAVLCIALLLDRSSAGQVSSRTIEVTASRFAFTPGEISLKKGQPVILVIKTSAVAHGLRFRELNLDVKVNKGGTMEMRFTPDKTGDFVGHCSVFCGSGHGAMTLTLHVVE